MARALSQKNLNTQIVDSVEKVSSEESLAMARRVIKEEGIPVGISSGAAVAAALRLAAKKENAGKLIVAIVASSSERYLSTLLAESERQQAAALTVSTVDENYLKRV